MTRRVMASSAARTARTYSFTSRRSRPVVSAACRKVRPFSLVSSRDPRAGRQRTFNLSNQQDRSRDGHNAIEVGEEGWLRPPSFLRLNIIPKCNQVHLKHATLFTLPEKKFPNRLVSGSNGV